MSFSPKFFKLPSGFCDMCRKNKATHWFGDTSVALCGDRDCAELNQRKWEEMLRQMLREEQDYD